MTAINRLRLAEHCHHAGSAGAIGAGLLACALVAGVGSLLPAKRELEQARLALVEAQQRAQAPKPEKPVQTVEEQLASFYEHFPDREQAPHLLEQVYAAAGDFGLEVRRGDYAVADDRRAGLISYQVLVPLSGQYTQIRGFVDQVLRSVPTLAVDELGFARQGISHSRLDAQVRLNLYMARM
ncbi:MAG: type 4a pilus biogenesis protein PilO [Zoogloeaceae bacterium]|nr:type 4a pilus biogenesis protein PilO [Rhodocyclaceae bacterium]MCP5234959.1 type 4a pilus biogenesis protein PilO [Zoogloeaceae bacterium]